VLLFWIFVGPAVLLGVLALRGERARAEYVAARMTALLESPARPLPPVTLIVPVFSGNPPEAPGLADALRSLAAQDHPDFELIVVVRDADSAPGSSLPSVVKVALAGDGLSLRQAGVRSARRRSEVLAFADASGTVSPYWLRALVAPLSEPGVGASTGFRWYVPDPPSFWSLMQSVWNGLIAGRLGPGPADFAWAGAMAITRTVFTESCVNESWGGVDPEDLALTSAVQESGKRIAYAPGAMVACPAGEFFRNARREMAQARRYLPRLWWTTLAAHTIYCGAMVAAIIAIAQGSRGAEWALVVQFGLGMLKGVNRATLAKAQLLEHKTWFDRYSWTHTFWTPAATWVWLCVLIGSLFTRPRAV